MRNKALNYFKTVIPARSENEGYARMAVTAFAAQLDPTIEELADIKTAVSEAVTNCIVHAYRGEQDVKKRIVGIEGSYDQNRVLKIVIKDNGCGIDDIEKAKEPIYTTSPETERSGMGFAIMESFTDRMTVRSRPGKGTRVTLVKCLSNVSDISTYHGTKR